MKTVKWMLVTTLAGTLLSGALFAYDKNQGYGPGNGPGCKNGPVPGKMMSGERAAGHGGMVMGMLFSLDLSDKQKEAIEKLMVENRYKMKGLWQDTRGDALKAALSDDGFDKKAYIKLSKERAEKRAEAMAEHLEKVMAVLTKEQKKALKEKVEKGDFSGPGFGPRR